MSVVTCDVVLPYHEVTVGWLPSAIDSILNQRSARCVIHVVADGVERRHQNVVQKMFSSQPDIRFYHNPQPIGPYQSCNAIFFNLETDFIAMQDSDDISLPNRIYHSISALQKHHADIAGFAAQNFVDPACRGRNDSLSALASRRWINYSGPSNDVYPNGFLMNPTMVLTKAVFKRLNGFTDWFSYCDAEFIERARASGCKVIHDDTVTVLRRLHSKSMTNNTQTGLRTPYHNEHLNKLYKRYKVFATPFDPAKYGALSNVRDDACIQC